MTLCLFSGYKLLKIISHVKNFSSFLKQSKAQQEPSWRLNKKKKNGKFVFEIYGMRNFSHHGLVDEHDDV